jgi:hypothetical protein
MTISSAQLDCLTISDSTNDTITLTGSAGGTAYYTGAGIGGYSSSDTITISGGGSGYSIGGSGSTITFTGTGGGGAGSSFIWTNPQEFVDCLPDFNRVQKMCEEYPGLKIAYEKFVTTYKLVRDDYDTPKDKRPKP